MKVLMVVSKLNIGGTETYVLSLAQALRVQGVHVGIATTGGPLLGRCRQLGIPVHLLPDKAAQPPAAYAKALAAIVTTHAYQVVHAHDTRSFRALQPLKRLHPLPVVVTIHGSYFHKNLIKTVAAQAQAVISVSPALSQWIRSCGVPAGQITVIPNGIDTAAFSPSNRTAPARKALQLPTQGKLIAYAARFSSDKQSIARQIIRAAEQLNRERPHVKTVLTGPGPFRKELHQLAAQANARLGRQAIFVRPPVLQMRTLYRAADLVVGTGRVALEAMACGKPVIASGVKGYLGLLTPERMERAITCHFGDHAADGKLTVPALSLAINRLLKKPELTPALGKFGRQLVLQRFSIRQVAARLAAIYRSAQQPKAIDKSKPIPLPKAIQPSKPIPLPKTIQPSKPIPRPKKIHPSKPIPLPKTIQPSKSIPLPKKNHPSKSLPLPKTIHQRKTISQPTMFYRAESRQMRSADSASPHR